MKSGIRIINALIRRDEKLHLSQAFRDYERRDRECFNKYLACYGLELVEEPKAAESRVLIEAEPIGPAIVTVHPLDGEPFQMEFSPEELGQKKEQGR